jgi:branched-chain amino acid aminotransferase
VALPAGAYTTLRTYHGDGVPFLEDHFRRLEDSAFLQGSTGSIDRAAARAGLAAVLRATGHPESRLRLTFAPPELFVSVEPFVPLPEGTYEAGVWCVTVPVRRETPQAKDTRFLASAQAAYRDLPAGAHEGLIVAEDGAVLEGLSSNVFAVLDGVLRTEDARCLRGTTRALVLELAGGLVPVSLEPFTTGDLGRAAEVFLTSVSREVLAVARVDAMPIGRGGGAGPLARELRRRYRARMVVAERLLPRG